MKLVRKITKRLVEIQRSAISATIADETSIIERNQASGATTTDWKPMEVSVEDELREAGDEVMGRMREVQREMLESLDLSK
jgi:N-acetyltransferase 10